MIAGWPPSTLRASSLQPSSHETMCGFTACLLLMKQCVGSLRVCFLFCSPVGRCCSQKVVSTTRMHSILVQWGQPRTPRPPGSHAAARSRSAVTCHSRCYARGILSGTQCRLQGAQRWQGRVSSWHKRLTVRAAHQAEPHSAPGPVHSASASAWWPACTSRSTRTLRWPTMTKLALPHLSGRSLRRQLPHTRSARSVA